MLSGNYTCFQSVCDAAINPVPGYYYVYPTCKSSCSLDEYSDDYGNCCMVDQMDCRGKCFGTAVIAKDFSHRPVSITSENKPSTILFDLNTPFNRRFVAMTMRSIVQVFVGGEQNLMHVEPVVEL